MEKRCSLLLVGWIILMLPNSLYAQGKMLTIDSCYKLAKQNYPLIKQHQLIVNSMNYTVENISKGNWPQARIAGQATYQSDVTSVPLPSAKPQAKDQYKLYGEISQMLYDGGTIKARTLQEKTGTAIEEQQLEVDLYKLKERINQLYFGIVLIEEQLKQSSLLSKDIQTGIDLMTAQVNNGTNYLSNLDILKAELLKADQQKTELQSGKQAFYNMLSMFTGQTINESWKLKLPAHSLPETTIHRPELLLFDYQKKNLDIQHQLIKSNTLPKVNLFVQGGIGRPALNILESDFKPYYIGGLQFNWGLAGFYTIKNEKALIKINQQKLDIQQETFMFNTTNTLKQQSEETIKYNKLLQSDEAIILLRNKVKIAASSQLQYGTINANDYMKEVNAEDQAKQNKIIHEIQLLMAEYTIKTTSGN